jgi:hypothetical protein
MSSYTTPVMVHFVVLAVLSGLRCPNFYYTDILWKIKMALHLLLAVVIHTDHSQWNGKSQVDTNSWSCKVVLLFQREQILWLHHI